jgi:hypothetical protein
VISDHQMGIKHNLDIYSTIPRNLYSPIVAFSKGFLHPKIYVKTNYMQYGKDLRHYIPHEDLPLNPNLILQSNTKSQYIYRSFYLTTLLVNASHVGTRYDFKLYLTISITFIIDS